MKISKTPLTKFRVKVANKNKVSGIKIILLSLLLLSASAISVIFFPKIINFNLEREKIFHILFKIRLPEVLIAITGGASLGLSGALMQIILNNPLASPFTLGISSASAFGAALAICLELHYFISWLSCGVFAFCFSILSVLLILLLVSISGISKKSIILVGLAINYFFNALNTILQYFATPDAVYQITFWTTGSLTVATLKHSLVLSILLSICLAVSILLSNDMGIIQQGERTAVIHGVNVNACRIIILIICSLLTATTVSIVGIIGFVGLVAPHIARLLELEKPINLIISSTLLGAILLVFANIISKSIISPVILPISAVTSFFGILLLVVILLCKRKKQK